MIYDEEQINDTKLEKEIDIVTNIFISESSELIRDMVYHCPREQIEKVINFYREVSRKKSCTDTIRKEVAAYLAFVIEKTLEEKTLEEKTEKKEFANYLVDAMMFTFSEEIKSNKTKKSEDN